MADNRITEEDFFDVEEIESTNDPQALAAARAELERRCKSVNYEVLERELFEDETYLSVGFPAGRKKRWVSLFDLDDLTAFLAIPFERYTFLSKYSAICSYGDDTIEAAVRPLNSLPSSAVYRRLLRRILGEGDDTSGDIPTIEIQQEDTTLSLTLGPSSEALQTLLSNRTGLRLSLAIKGAQVSQHDRSVSLLERVADSLFFQIDLSLDIPLSLTREKRLARRVRAQGQRPAINLQFPRTEYDEAPISLYWYARSATGMPLLQFLAFYQVLEFYFSTYYQAEARRKIRSSLKDPTFRPDRDVDIGRVIDVTRLGSNAGYGDERSQLRATLQECVDPNALRTFLTDNESRKKFFSSKTKGLTSRQLPIANPDVDLRNDVADRIYDIRCKIVHTKGESRNGEIELLLPFSEEAEQLVYDIDLLQYVAQRALIAASSSLRL